jgi:hypothetical protein
MVYHQITQNSPVIQIYNKRKMKDKFSKAEQTQTWDGISELSILGQRLLSDIGAEVGN